MDLKNLLLDVDNDVATIHFNRPEALNALNREIIAELGRAIGHCKEDEAVKAVVLTGSGEKAFVAGADITEISRMRSIKDVMDFIELGHNTFRAIELMGKPVIAAVSVSALRI